ncbi:addiction module protein [Marinobacter salexigens]
MEEALTRNQTLPEPPEWHQAELRKRAAKIQEGKVSYTSLNKLKERGAQE